MAKRIYILLFLAAYFTTVYSLFSYFDISCVFLHFFGFPCPGCGMTRAFLSLVKFDFPGAFKNNVLIFFMPYVFLYILFDFKHRVHKYLLSAIAIIAIINWFVKLILYF